MVKPLSKLYLTPSMAVSLLALVIALGGAGYAATGGAFILGFTNSAAKPSALSSKINDRALTIGNLNVGAQATALGLFVAPGHPPLTVNSTGKVKNLNADLIDGRDGAHLPTLSRVAFSLADGENSAPIKIPANRPVLIAAVQTVGVDRGAAQATVLQSGGFLWWSGVNAFSPTTTAGGISGTAGSPIIFIDRFHGVSVQVAGPDSIRVHNGSGVDAGGSISLIY